MDSAAKFLNALKWLWQNDFDALMIWFSFSLGTLVAIFKEESMGHTLLLLAACMFLMRIDKKIGKDNV